MKAAVYVVCAVLMLASLGMIAFCWQSFQLDQEMAGWQDVEVTRWTLWVRSEAKQNTVPDLGTLIFDMPGEPDSGKWSGWIKTDSDEDKPWAVERYAEKI